MYHTILWTNSGWPHLGVFPLTLRKEGWARSDAVGTSPRSREGGAGSRGVERDTAWIGPYNCAWVSGEDATLVQLWARSAAQDRQMFLQISIHCPNFLKSHTVNTLVRISAFGCSESDQCNALSLVNYTSSKLLLPWFVYNVKNFVNHFDYVYLLLTLWLQTRDPMVIPFDLPLNIWKFPIPLELLV